MQHDHLSRRHLFASAAGLSLAATTAPLSARAASGLPLKAPVSYDFEALRKHARSLAAAPYVAPKVVAADVLQSIGFDAYQKIVFRPKMTLWADGESAYPVRLFHLGRYFKLPVRIHVVENGEAREITYSPDIFSYGDPSLAKRLPDDLGFAGFRLMNPGKQTDWLSYLGASYFRASGPEGQYGMSARGLAIDTGLPQPEEFPRFSAFWLHRTAPGSMTMTIDALLESESCCGAYRFEVTNAKSVTTDVEAHLYVRQAIKRLGVAPLTSMFWYSETNRLQGIDWRPEIHDSDGLALWTGAGERIWRQLNDPPKVMTSSFVDDNPKGFGLLQRDRNFDHYQDDGAFYNKRPGVWVEPGEAWSKGEVQLLEMPTDDEIQDNIAAYWKPATPVKAGDTLGFTYRLHWVDKPDYPPQHTAHVVATRTGIGGVPGQPRPKDSRKFVIDFVGPATSALAQRYDVEVVTSASRGTIRNPYAIRVVGTDVWRAFFDLDGVEGAAPVELRCFLRLDGKVLTETWLFQYLPPARQA